MKKLIAFLILTIPAWAGKPLELSWETICTKTDSHRLLVMTLTGPVVGKCAAVTGDVLSIGGVRISRDSIETIRMFPNRQHLHALGDSVAEAIGDGISCIFSQDFALGLIAIPANIVRGIVELPVAAYQDIDELIQGSREIRIK